MDFGSVDIKVPLRCTCYCFGDDMVGFGFMVGLFCVKLLGFCTFILSKKN